MERGCSQERRRSPSVYYLSLSSVFVFAIVNVKDSVWRAGAAGIEDGHLLVRSYYLYCGADPSTEAATIIHPTQPTTAFGHRWGH